MYIEPNSIIKIYKFLPLNNTYEHTVYFRDRAEQNSYFHTNNDRVKYILNRQSYQRVNKNTMRVQIKADDLYDCNYIAFKNSSYGVKWFYAFILSVEYVNNETSEITYEIDVIQTYLLDVGFGFCMVEREHTETDNVGEHIASEPINCGDVYCHEFVQTNLFQDYCAVIATGKKGSDEQYAGGVRGGLFSGINYMIAEINDDEGVNALLEYLELLVEMGDDEAVVSIFLCPYNTIPYTKYEPRTNVFAIPTPTKFSYGYEPRNKKLLTYPYMYLNVDCGTDNIDYRYEWFNSDSTLGLLSFNIISTLSCNHQIQLVPKGYQCDSDTMNWSSSIILDGFPQCAWAIDSYKRYLARNATKTNFSILKAAEQTIFNGAFNLNIGGIVNGITNIAETSALAFQAQKYGVAPRGNSNGTVETASRVKDFYFRRMEINVEYAKMVDNFFDMYGYATNTLKLPRYNVRPYWNYIKTNNCVIASSSAPNEATKKISEIFNKGITFWKSMMYVGDYSKDNRPISE